MISNQLLIDNQQNTSCWSRVPYSAKIAIQLAVAGLLLSVCGFYFKFLVNEVETRFQTVAIIGTNDIHGSAFPTALYRSDTSESYTYGGLQIMAQMIGTLQKEYGGNLLYFDAGDQFQGGIQSSSLVSSGQIMNDFYNSIGLDAAAIGNHQFDFNTSFLFSYWAGRNQGTPNLAANLVSQNGTEDFLPLQKGQKMFLLDSGIKIGLIGLSTIETPATTNGFASNLFPKYQFLNYTDRVIERSNALRDLGANAVLIVSHVGNDCNATNKYGIWNKQTVADSTCSSTDEISKLLRSVPKGTIDGIIQGHRHKFSHHYIQGIPVVGTINGGYYFNVLYLQFVDGKIQNSLIQGPVPVCEKVFQQLGTCNFLTFTQLLTAGKLVEWDFHGERVKKHQGLKATFDAKWLPSMSQYLQFLVNNQVYMTKIYDYQNDLGNLITNLMYAAVPGIDIVIVNAGGFRTTWIPGAIQYQHFFNMFPFNNVIVSFDMNGQEIIDMLTIVQAGTKAFYPTYGLAQIVSLSASKVKKFISATLYDGTPISPTQNYRMLSIDFLTNGGDDFRNFINKNYTVRGLTTHGQMRALLAPQLKKLVTIRSNVLVDKNKPRLKVQAVP